MRTFPIGDQTDFLARSVFPSNCNHYVPAGAQSQERGANQELTFSLGGTPGQTRSFQGSAGTAQVSADRSFGINYGHRFLEAKIAALYGEVEFVAIPNRALTAASATVPQNYASLYLTPGLRLKFFPGSRLSPWGCHWWRLWSLSAVRAALEWAKHDEQILEPGRLRVRRWFGLQAISFHWLAWRGA